MGRSMYNLPHAERTNAAENQESTSVIVLSRGYVKNSSVLNKLANMPLPQDLREPASA